MGLIQKNIGTTDRILRLAIALILLFLAYWFSSWILLFFSLFTFFESFMSWCVLYQLLGKNSCPIPKDKTKKQ